MIKRNIYKWHRSLSIIIALPVIMWTLSGIMHPIMTSFKPKVKNQFLMAKTIDLAKAKLSLDSVMIKNKIESISNFRMVEVGDSLYYQLRKNDLLTYINAETGIINKIVEKQYAKKIAANFLGDSTAKIASVKLLDQFDDEYLEINRLLPVYKVTFDRKDGIRLYVDVTTDRLGLAMDNQRATFHAFFRNFHSWEFLEKLGNFRLVVLVALAGLSFITAICGIYITFISKSKKGKNGENTAVKYRRWHRQIAIWVSITTLMFTFSGAYHAFVKFEPDTRQQYFIEDQFSASAIKFNLDSIAKNHKVKNMSLVKMDGKTFLRVTCSSSKGMAKEDCCEKMAVAASMFGIEKKSAAPVIHYLSLPQLTELPKGEEQYARFMATKFSNDTNIVSVTPITEFKGEYGFINKRLPVFKVQYKANANERWYVEPSSGKLAVRINDKDLREGLSFALLHKFHFADAMGKTTRDVLTVIAALGNLLVSLVGIVLLVFWIKKKKKIPLPKSLS